MRYVPSFAKAQERDGGAETQQQPDLTPIDDASALAFLQAIYRDRQAPLAVRLRAAIEALPFEAPKLSAVAVGHMSGEDFASRLDRAIARSGNVPLTIEAKAIGNC